MSRIILELEGPLATVDSALADLIEAGIVSVIKVRTMEDVAPNRSIVQDWCDSAKELNAWAKSKT